jgi:hypothetical protein
MTDELITPETFQLAKEIGFDEHICRCGGFPDCICNHDELLPTQSLLRKWLREEYSLHVEVKPWKSKEDVAIWFAQVFTLKFFNVSFNSFEYVTMFSRGETYEEALELGLVEALKRIKSTNKPTDSKSDEN